jgi:predicted phage terminase large subunit-like protein
MRVSTTVGGRGVGWHCHVQVVDDPVKPADVAVVDSTTLEKANRWWGNTMASRKADPAFFARIIMMQRVHESDLSGRCIKAGGWEHMCYPMEYRTDHPYLCDDDPRTIDGELLCEDRFSRRDVDSMRREMGPAVASAQFDQVPSPIGGGVFKRAWLSNFWTRLPSKGTWYQSWDHTFGSLDKKASYVVGQVWLKSAGESYLVDQVRGRMEFPDMLSSLRTLSGKYPEAFTKLVEAKASGPAIEQMLRREIGGIVMVKADASTGGKLARAHGVSGLYESGSVRHPHPTDARLFGESHPCVWAHDMIERMVGFTGSKADVSDEVDAASQALAYMHGSGASRFARAMVAARERREATRRGA